MRKSKIYAVRALLITLVILLAGLIFYLSADNADESNAKSDIVADSFAARVLSSFNLSDEQIELIIEKSVFIVRKTAHFAEYALLGFLLTAVAVSFGKTCAGCYAIAQITASAYAISDEIHQLFAEGRSCQIRDMIIDSAGAAAGIALMLIFTAVFRKIARRREKNQ
ncbi:MAG: VanZ family protein [Clostridiales bacterium]|nr:VanZ family protein [Clostridiales bacterium]